MNVFTSNPCPKTKSGTKVFYSTALFLNYTSLEYNLECRSRCVYSSKGL